MKILITGAEGFAGSHLVDHCLEQGDEVWGTCMPGARTINMAHQLDHITLRIGDLTQPDFLRGVLRIFHPAEQPVRRPDHHPFMGVHQRLKARLGSSFRTG